MADGKGQAAAQKRNDVSRHEAFVELHNLSRTHNEEFLVPEIALVGKLRNYAYISAPLAALPSLIAGHVSRWRPSHTSWDASSSFGSTSNNIRI